MKKIIFFFLFSLFVPNLRAQNSVNFTQINAWEREANNPKNDPKKRVLASRKVVKKIIYADPILGRKKVQNYRKLAIQFNNKKAIINSYQYDGVCLSRLAMYDSAIVAYRTGEKLAKEANFPLKVGHARMNIGTVYELMSELDSALVYYLKAKNTRLKSFSADYQTRLSINLGGVYEKRGEYKQSLAYLEESLELCKRHNLLGYLSAIYRNLGNVNTDIGAYDRAEYYYKQAIYSAAKNKNNNTLFQAYERLAEMKFAMENYPEAIANYRKAMTLAEHLNAHMDWANANSGLARTYEKMGKYALAKKTIDASVAIIRKQKINTHSYQIPVIAGSIYYRLNLLSESQQFCEKGYKSVQESNDVNYLVEVTNLLHQLHKKNGNSAMALFYLEECYKYSEIARNSDELKDVMKLDLEILREKEIISDSLKSVAKIQGIQLKHENALRNEQWNSILALFGVLALLIVAITLGLGYRQKRKQTLILQHKNALIKQAMLDKNFLLREVNHRVKNNMQMVSGLLQLKAKRTDNPAAKEALLDGQARIHSMSLAHQQMYQAENYELINIAQYIDDILKVLLTDPAKSIVYNIQGDTIRLEVEPAQTIGFVIHELVTNSIKHAWTDETHKAIDIAINTHDDHVTLTYSDNGVGMADTIELSSSESFGLKMIHSFVKRQLKGSIELKNDAGARYEIRFEQPRKS